MKVVLKKKNINIFYYLFALVLCLDCCSIWTAMPSISWFDNFLIIMLTISVLGCLLTSKIYKNNFLKITFFIFFVVLYSLLYIVINPINISLLIKVILKCLIVTTFFLLINNENMVLKVLFSYEKIILFICIVSLFFYLFGSILGYIRSTGFIYTSWTNSTEFKKVPTYYNIYYETQYLEFVFFRIPKNSAIFTEAPMCSLHFSIALLIELFLKKEYKISKCIILAVGIISTFSSTGLILLVLALTIKYILISPKMKIFKLIKIITIPIIIVIAILASEYILMDKLSSLSGSTRLDDFRAGWKAWSNSPLFGNGYNASLVKYMSSFRLNNTGFSNSPMLILAYGGIYMLSPYIYCIIFGFWNNLKQKKYFYVCFVAFFVYLFTVTVVPYQALTMYILAFFLVSGQ